MDVYLWEGTTNETVFPATRWDVVIEVTSYGGDNTGVRYLSTSITPVGRQRAISIFQQKHSRLRRPKRNNSTNSPFSSFVKGANSLKEEGPMSKNITFDTGIEEYVVNGGGGFAV